MPMRKCPICDENVKLENLKRHVKKHHPHDPFNLNELMSENEQRCLKEDVKVSKPRRGQMALGASSMVIIAIIIVAVVLLQPGDVEPTFGNQVGDVAPEFVLQTSENASLALSSLRGKPVLLIFVDIDGGPCRAECDVLASVYQNFSSTVHFFTIDLDIIAPADTNERINDFRLTKNTPWPYAIDNTRDIMASYGIITRPCVFVIDENGIIRQKFVGRSPCGCDCYSTALNTILQG